MLQQDRATFKQSRPVVLNEKEIKQIKADMKASQDEFIVVGEPEGTPLMPVQQPKP